MSTCSSVHGLACGVHYHDRLTIMQSVSCQGLAGVHVPQEAHLEQFKCLYTPPTCSIPSPCLP